MHKATGTKIALELMKYVPDSYKLQTKSNYTYIQLTKSNYTYIQLTTLIIIYI